MDKDLAKVTLCAYRGPSVCGRHMVSCRTEGSRCFYPVL